MADATDTSSTEQAEDYGTAEYWNEQIATATTFFAKYQEKCDNVEKLFADLDARSSDTADREFQIFWANLEVLKPSIYSRPPVPVVSPRFQNRKELPRTASEMLERCLVSSFEREDIDATMRLVRDDLAMNSRGVIWPRYETETEDIETDAVDAEGKPVIEQQLLSERVPKEHVDRRDFLHDSTARKWAEVGWVAKRSWLTRRQGLKRFGEIFLKAETKAREGETEGKKVSKAPVWEIWSKIHSRVIWLSPGMDELLDDQPPFLKLDGFFPCPRPAYGTLKPRTLLPVPDLVQYKDQLEEINEFTARISSLAESLRLKGFYPGGASDVGDAIEAVLKDQSNNATLVPINSLAAFGGDKALRDVIVWLPVDMVATVIKELVALRRQMIDDVYQITGISDIMRGTTVASETLGAQQLKSQYGSIRVRDRQNELVRLARDVSRIEGEIIAENFSPETLMAMSQMDDLPTEEQIGQQIAQVTQQVQAAAADPAIVQQAQQQPEQAKQMIEAAKAYVAQLEATVTFEKVVGLLREQRLRPYILDIETDSTIQPDEDAAKQRATEFVSAVGQFMAQALPLAQQVPEAAPMMAETLKYVSGQFRAGRQLFGVIDEFADKLKEIAAQPKGPSPEQQKAEADAARQQQDTERKAAADQAKATEDARKAAHDERMALMDERMKSIDLAIKNLDLAIARANAVAPAVAATAA